MDIPRTKNYSVGNDFQCDNCGGHGCFECGYKGWLTLTVETYDKIRRCKYLKCSQPLPPDHVAVYCSNTCAFKDAK